MNVECYHTKTHNDDAFNDTNSASYTCPLFVQITTAASCAFLIVKVILSRVRGESSALSTPPAAHQQYYYCSTTIVWLRFYQLDWLCSDESVYSKLKLCACVFMQLLSQGAFGYLLPIISFVLAWIETWLLDFKVLPREAEDENRESQSHVHLFFFFTALLLVLLLITL